MSVIDRMTPSEDERWGIVADPKAPSAQERQAWFAYLRDPADCDHVTSVVYDLRGPIDVERLATSVVALASVYPQLRTVYRAGKGGNEVHRVIDESMAPEFVVENLTELDGRARERRVRVLVNRNRQRPFALDSDSPLRVLILELETNRHLLAVFAPAVLWSTVPLGDLLTELTGIYRGGESAARADSGRVVPGESTTPQSDTAAPDVDTADCGAAQVTQLCELLGDAPSLPVLMPPPVRAGGGEFGRDVADIELPADIVERCEQLAATQDVPQASIYLAVFSALIHRYTGTEDLVVAVPAETAASAVASEGGGVTRSSGGGFGSCDPVALRLTPTPTQALETLIEDTAGALDRSRRFAQVRLDEVVAAVNPRRTSGRDGWQNLIGIGFEYVTDEPPVPLFPGIEARVAFALGRTVPTALSLTVVGFGSSDDDTEDGDRRGKASRAILHYRADEVDSAGARQLLRHYRNLLCATVSDARTQVRFADPFGAQRDRQLELGRGQRASHSPTTLVAEFESAVAAFPEANAVLQASDDGFVPLRYAELNRRINRLARWLISRGIGPESVVGVVMESSTDFVVTVMAILKAGGAYLPIDPDNPASRIDFLAHDGAPVLVLDSDAFVAAESESSNQPDHNISDEDRLGPLRPDNLAYLMYTSGSTGRPKGVAVSHRAIADHVRSFRAEWSMTSDDSLLHTLSVSFDATLLDVFVTLTLGASLVIPVPGRRADLPHLAEIITAQQVSVVHVSPPLLNELIALPDVSDWRSLRHVAVGGDVLSTELSMKTLGCLDAALRNHYGPTEAVVSATHHEVNPADFDRAVPIGIPNQNVDVYVLDSALQPVPAGAIGEIYVGGEQLARGYHRRAVLTAERFVADPFSSGQRLYRTGDLARMRVDGILEFVGRGDRQLSVRGHRVEPAEITVTLESVAGVSDAFVAVHDPGDGAPVLCAYLVTSQELDLAAVRAQLAATLPEFMIPVRYACVSDIPLTEAGTVDTDALPTPHPPGPRITRAPSGHTETFVATLFAEILGVDEVFAESSFFELGGHSLLVHRVLAGINEHFRIRLELRDFFGAATVSALSTVIDRTAVAADPSPHGPSVGTPPEYVQLTSAQQAQNDAERRRLRGVYRIPGPVDKATFERAFADVVHCNDALRIHISADKEIEISK